MLAVAMLAAEGIGACHWTRSVLPPPSANPPNRETYKGSVNIRIWDHQHLERRFLWLNQPGALPLRAGDLVRVEAEVYPASYLYLVGHLLWAWP
jgi:hypothetical protein